MGRAAMRSVLAHPRLDLSALLVSNPSKVGNDVRSILGEPTPWPPGGTGPLAVVATDDVEAVLGNVDAVAYMASGELRPDDAIGDIERCLRAGAAVVSPSVYALYDPRSAPAELVERLSDACGAGDASLFVSGIDPGWANDVLPVLASGLSSRVTEIRAMEIFDYSTYDQPDTVRNLVGMGMPMDQVPLMVAPTIPTSVWGAPIRLMARGLGVQVDEIREVVDRRPLEHDVENVMGHFAAGTQGALRFELQGMVAGRAMIVVEHVTRIDGACAPDWPQPVSGSGTHLVRISGEPDLTITVEAEAEGSNRAAGGNATAANRLVGAIPWLVAAPPGVYDALDVPLPAGHLEVAT